MVRKHGSPVPRSRRALGFSPTETTYFVADCATAVWRRRTASLVPVNFGVSVTGYIDAVLHADTGSTIPELPVPPVWPTPLPTISAPGIDERRQKTVERIKASKNYTPDVIGLTLRTEATGTVFNPTTYKARRG